MPNQKQSLSISISKAIAMVSLIMGVGFVLGIATYSINKKDTIYHYKQQKEKVESVKLQDLFSANVQIIEEEFITNVNNRKIVLWMIAPEKYPKTDDVYTCPETTRGSYYKGQTRVSLIDLDRMKIINTLEITSPYSDLDKFDVPYRVKDDAGPYFVKENPKGEEGTPKIIKLRDYNQDEKELEFALFDSPACISPLMTIIGYSEKQDKIIQYDFNIQEKKEDKITSKSDEWISKIFLNESDISGYWEAESNTCGRGGAIEKSKIIYNREKEVFEGEIEINDCENELDISNWKTYRNEEYGFEMQYPKDWITKNENQRFYFNSASSEDDLGISGFSIRIRSKDYLSLNGRYIYVAKDIEEKEIIVEGIKGVDIITKEWLNSYRTIYIQKDDKTFVLATINPSINYEEVADLINKDKEIKENLKKFDQILSTFKFIEK